MRVVAVFCALVVAHGSDDVQDYVTDVEQGALLQTTKIALGINSDAVVQQLQEVTGEQWSEHLLALAGNSTNDVTRELLKSFRICGQCGKFQRLGEPYDGGYLTCMDSHEKIVGALSLGVEHHDQWTLDVRREFGVPIGQFDCTVDAGTDCGGECKFFKQCIGSADGHGTMESLSPVVTLEQALAQMQFGAAADGSLLMKMDIEGSEWPIYEVEPVNILKKFQQIIVEFHGLQQPELHAQMYKGLTTLLGAGFSVAHLHGNNFDERSLVAGNFQIPNVLEVTFLANAAPRSECASWEALPDDAPNAPGEVELPAAQLPQ